MTLTIEFSDVFILPVVLGILQKTTKVYRIEVQLLETFTPMFGRQSLA